MHQFGMQLWGAQQMKCFTAPCVWWTGDPSRFFRFLNRAYFFHTVELGNLCFCQSSDTPSVSEAEYIQTKYTPLDTNNQLQFMKLRNAFAMHKRNEPEPNRFEAILCAEKNEMEWKTRGIRFSYDHVGVALYSMLWVCNVYVLCTSSPCIFDDIDKYPLLAFFAKIAFFSTVFFFFICHRFVIRHCIVFFRNDLCSCLDRRRWRSWCWFVDVVVAVIVAHCYEYNFFSECCSLELLSCSVSFSHSSWSPLPLRPNASH